MESCTDWCVIFTDMFDELDRARVIGDGSHHQRMDALKSVQLLILDD